MRKTRGTVGGVDDGRRESDKQLLSYKQREKQGPSSYKPGETNNANDPIRGEQSPLEPPGWNKACSHHDFSLMTFVSDFRLKEL